MVKTIESVKRVPFFHLFARNWIEQIATDTGAFRVAKSDFRERFPPRAGTRWDIILELETGQQAEPSTLLIECRKQLTPRAAIGLLDSCPRPADATLMLFSPTISPRVAEICRERHVGYLDAAGNCLLRAAGVYIERSGRDNVQPDTRPIRRLFSPKASRVTRAMLSEPGKAWQVQELATAAGVSLGLASKVKQSLLSEGYAVERDRLLCLRDPRDLLNAWARAYRPQMEPIPLWVHAEAPDIAVARWLERKGLTFALSQFAGAWRAAAMVRYTRLTFWVDPLSPAALEDFRKETRAQRVDSGENVVLWQTDDESVFTGSRLLGNPPLPVVSSLQLYLDLQTVAGRGEEAAAAIYDLELAQRFAVVQVSVGADSKRDTVNAVEPSERLI
jgi:hypothetical protein